MPYEVLDSAMKPAALPVLCATRLMDQVRVRICYKHYSLCAEQACVQWVCVFVKWHGLTASAMDDASGNRALSAHVGLALAAWLNDSFGAVTWMAA